MTFKYNNVYINNTSTVVGPYEAKGPLKDLYDKIYKDFYFGEKTWEQAEIRSIIDSVEILLNKQNKKNSDIDIHIGGDLLNQITATTYGAIGYSKSFMGIYSILEKKC